MRAMAQSMDNRFMASSLDQSKADAPGKESYKTVSPGASEVVGLLKRCVNPQPFSDLVQATETIMRHPSDVSCTLFAAPRECDRLPRDSDDLLFRDGRFASPRIRVLPALAEPGESGEGDIRTDVIQHEPDLITFGT